LCGCRRAESSTIARPGISDFLLARRTRLGRAYPNDTGLITSRMPDTVRGADVACFSYERLPKEQRPRGFSTVPPELVIEVAGLDHPWEN